MIELDPGETIDVAGLADLLDLTPRRIAQLAVEGVIPKAKHGEYLLRDAIRGYVTHLQGKHGANGVQALSAERAALAKAQREMTELKNKQLSGELVPAPAAVKALQALGGAMKSRLLNLPATVRQRHPDIRPVVVADMRKLIEDALRQVAESGLPDEYRIPVSASSGDAAAAGKAKSKRVGRSVRGAVA